MDPKAIEKLSQVIREQGDKLLTSEFKFTLTGEVLRALNDSFSLIIDENELIQPQSFQVTKPNNSKSNVFRELMFIYDFIQKTLVLKLTKYNDEDLIDDDTGVVDISKFRNLTTLEIQKIPIRQIKGLQQLRQQLQQLTVEKSLTNVRDLLTQCAGDNCTGFMWNSLKRVDFSYNNLERVDNSFEFTPYIQFLNLSHNKIVHITILPYLPNLKILNLSYNQLTTIPKFSVESNKRLQVLILNDNCVEDISGLVWLETLLELDLSGNCLLDHALLLPLCTLYSLRYLNLMGNPLAYHPKHRVATCRYLSTNARTIQFQLDNELLTKYENSLTGNYENYYPIFGHRMNIPRTRTSSNMVHTPSTKSICSNTPESLGSNNSLLALNSSQNASSQKKMKARAVVIEESGKHSEAVKSPAGKRLLKEGSKEHLVTKKEIEELREKFGDAWLFSQSEYGGERDASAARRRLELSDILSVSPGALRMDESFEGNEQPLDASTPQEVTLMQNNADDDDEKTLYRSIDDSAAGASVYASALEDTFTVEEAEEEIVVSEPEDNEAQFIVIDETTKEDLFLILTESTIKEREAMTGRTLTKWGIGTLQSVERVRSNVIHLSFDTIRKDKREREYRIDVKCCQEVEKLLRDYLSSRPLSEMNQTIYKCPKCNSQFCRENDDRSKKSRQNDIKCPSCGNKYIIEIQKTNKCATSPKSTFLPGNVLSSLATNAFQKQQQQHPASSIAIDNKRKKKAGEEVSLGVGIPKANHSFSSIESAFDSNQSVAGSSVEILSECSSQVSHTSQSSIEVLDHYGSRKPSEERKISTIPSLDTIDDDVKYDERVSDKGIMEDEMVVKKVEEEEEEKPKIAAAAASAGLGIGNVNLTESSSSGSVCESVCTAYEQNGKKKSSTSDESKSPLEGIFKTSSLLLSKTVSKKEPEPINTHPTKPIAYNFEDLAKVDHRLKLYIFQHILENNDEKFMWLVKCIAIEDDLGVPFCAIIVMSTKKFYLLKIVGEEREDIAVWLKKSASYLIDQIAAIREIPFEGGLSFETKSGSHFHILLCDAKLSAVLQKHITTSNQMLEIQSDPLESVHGALMNITKGNEPKYLAIFTACNTFLSSASEDDEAAVPKKSLKCGLLLVTVEAIYCTTSFQWLCSASESGTANNKLNGNIISEGNETLVQPMTNLVELENLSRNSFTLNFMDELENTIERWKLSYESFARISKTLEVIDEIWRTIFCMPLVTDDQLMCV